jgi:hypothetical protein
MYYYEGVICGICGEQVCYDCGSCHNEHSEEIEEAD